MNFHEFALLFAVAVPVVVIVGINAYLWLGGENETLLFPSLRPYPSIDTSARAVDETPAATATVASEAAANEEEERLAA